MPVSYTHLDVYKRQELSEVDEAIDDVIDEVIVVLSDELKEILIKKMMI